MLGRFWRLFFCNEMLPPQFYMYYVTILVFGVVMGSTTESSWMLLGGTSAAQAPFGKHSRNSSKNPDLSDSNTDEDSQRRRGQNGKESNRITKRKIEAWCMSLPGLVPRQQKMCISNPALVAAAARGTEMAVRECERQFKHMRWNCSLIFNQYAKSNGRRRAADGATVVERNRMKEVQDDVLAPGLRNATKESAFLHAIMSAGIAYSVTLACSTGELFDCHCDKSVTKLDIDIEILAEKIVSENNSQDSVQSKYKYNSSSDKRSISKRSTLTHLKTNESWVESYPGNELNNFNWSDERNFLSWGGCSDDVRYGVRYSRRFVEAPYKGILRRKLTTTDAVNLHNSEVGRRVVQSMRKMHCKCHGMSGSCNVQTCWMQMASFHEIGDRLREKYLAGIQTYTDGKRQRRLKYVTDSGRMRRVPKTELTFMNLTPSLCSRNDSLGILGTAGRKCLKHSGDAGDCRYLCCGRGFNVKEIRTVNRCECHFVWCCRVRCNECVVVKEEYTCKT